MQVSMSPAKNTFGKNFPTAQCVVLCVLFFRVKNFLFTSIIHAFCTTTTTKCNQPRTSGAIELEKFTTEKRES